MQKKKVVIDIDDTCWPLNSRICHQHQIDIRNITAFNIKECNKLSDEQKRILLFAYNDVHTFQNIVWYDGVQDIPKLEQYGAEVHIDSNNCTQDILLTKKRQILRFIALSESRVNLRLIKDTMDKELSDDVFIFCDDSPYHLKKSNAKYNLTLNKPWNTSENGLNILGGKKVLRFNTFREMHQGIIDLLLHG